MHEDPPRDSAERNIRLFFGILLGLFVAGVIGFKTYPSWTTWAILCVVCPVVCGWLAVQYGDGFWFKMLRLMRWW
ncbi:hypothetical protein WH367_06880 [Comamonas sp. MYb21]|uniref:hypothetical protein n=1 Tax=unclassified Comamonas TaxID=2638500 RepID=UPI0030A22C26